MTVILWIKLWIILFVFRGEGMVEDFPGNYSDFRTYEDSTPVAAEPKKITDFKGCYRKSI